MPLRKVILLVLPIQMRQLTSLTTGQRNGYRRSQVGRDDELYCRSSDGLYVFNHGQSAAHHPLTIPPRWQRAWFVEQALGVYATDCEGQPVSANGIHVSTRFCKYRAGMPSDFKGMLINELDRSCLPCTSPT